MGGRLKPYVITQGDTLAKLAFLHGFDASEVWELPENAGLRALRRDRDVLQPGDVLQLPTIEKRGLPITSGATNLREEGLHFCVGRSDLAVIGDVACDEPDPVPKPRQAEFDDIHIDWECPVQGIDPTTKRCDIDIGIAGALHWIGARFGAGHPMFVFEAVPAKIESMRKAMASADDPEAEAVLGDIPERWEKTKKELEQAQSLALIGTGPSTAAEAPVE